MKKKGESMEKMSRLTCAEKEKGGMKEGKKMHKAGGLAKVSPGFSKGKTNTYKAKP